MNAQESAQGTGRAAREHLAAMEARCASAMHAFAALQQVGGCPL